MAAEGSEDLSSNGELGDPPAPEVSRAAESAAEAEMAEVSEENGSGEEPVTPVTEVGPVAPEEAAGPEEEAPDPSAYSLPPAEEDDEGELPMDFDRLWKAAHENPQDFSGWTDLLQYCEQESHMTASRRALVAFLARYPLCYGYWKKYADLERRNGQTDRAEEVCVQGLKAIPLSVDLWIHYINLLLGTLDMNLPESPRRIRCAFEEALAAAGLDWHSARLWDLYVEWEKEQGDARAAAAVYDRALRAPTQMYSTHYDKLKAHLSAHEPRAVLSGPEYEELRVEVRQAQRAERAAARAEGAELEEERPPGEEEPEEPDGKDSEDLVQRVRELALARRERVYQLLEGEVRKRWNFEDAIKRPYFHVKPLDRAQIRAWHAYLDWELTQVGLGGGGGEGGETETEDPEFLDALRESGVVAGGDRRVRILFERCLIACALYEEFWTKYVAYLEPQSLAEARGLFRRACEIHLSHTHTIHLQWATFEERHGDLSEARRVLVALEASMPGVALVRLRRAGLERRGGRLDEAEALLREALAQARDTSPALHAFYSIKLARFLLKLGKNPGRARGVLQEALDISPENSKLHLNLLELEVSGDPRGSLEGVQECVTRALAAPLSPRTKILFSQRGLQYAEDYGNSVQSVLSVYEEHQRLLKDLSSRKRAAENGDSEEPEKMSKADDDSAAPAAPPAAPHVPMTTPPPPVVAGDMSGAAAAGYGGYGGYNSWYQQPQYGGYGYQSPWNYSQGYYPPS